MAAYPVIDAPPPRPKRWTKREYLELVEKGAFEGQRVYLFRGEIFEMAPQLHPHTYTVTKLNEELWVIFGLRQGHDVRIQSPFETPGETVPEPDAAVCSVAEGGRKPHPNRALLVVEVAYSSLAADRKKALEYAAAQVPEYWIIDVIGRRTEVFRHPVSDQSAPLGYRYSSMTLVDERTPIELVSKPGSGFLLSTVLPQS